MQYPVNGVVHCGDVPRGDADDVDVAATIPKLATELSAEDTPHYAGHTYSFVQPSNTAGSDVLAGLAAMVAGW